MPKAIVIEEFGGPEVLQWRDVDPGKPDADEVRVRHKAVGLNFIDTYHRSGLYPLELPSGIGLEAAGEVVAAGGDAGFAAGDRVACTSPPPGAYAEERIYKAANLVRVPDAVSDDTAAASMLKGLTAWYLLHRSYAVEPGDAVLLYAAAGGVGQIAARWAAHLGARVIGVVSTDEKAQLAREAGCAEVVMADDADFVASVRRAAGEEGVAAVYDSVGRVTFMQSLDCLRPHGTMVSYGNASGPVDPVSPLELSKRGSLFLTRPVLFDFIRETTVLRDAAARLFDLIERGILNIHIGQRWPLAEAAEAHRALEARRTTGSTLLDP